MQYQDMRRQRRPRRIVTNGAAILLAAAIAAGVILYNKSTDVSTGPLPVHLPPAASSYLGVFAGGAPASYAGVTAFAHATGSRPDVVMYYSDGMSPFRSGLPRPRPTMVRCRACRWIPMASKSLRLLPGNTTAT